MNYVSFFFSFRNYFLIHRGFFNCIVVVHFFFIISFIFYYFIYFERRRAASGWPVAGRRHTPAAGRRPKRWLIRRRWPVADGRPAGGRTVADRRRRRHSREISDELHSRHTIYRFHLSRYVNRRFGLGFAIRVSEGGKRRGQSVRRGFNGFGSSVSRAPRIVA